MEKKIVTIAGKKYLVEVRKGIPYIDGKTVEEFQKTLTPEELLDSAIVGANFIDDSSKSPQKMFNELYQKKNN